MRMRIVKTIKTDSDTFYPNEIAWLKAVKWGESGDFQYLIEIKGKMFYIDKKYVEHD